MTWAIDAVRVVFWLTIRLIMSSVHDNRVRLAGAGNWEIPCFTFLSKSSSKTLQHLTNRATMQWRKADIIAGTDLTLHFNSVAR